MASFERVFNLAKKTGDRMIVFDSSTGEGFAAIPFDEYEEMVTDPRAVRSMSGDDLLEQINHDIALWKAHQEAMDQEEFADFLEEKMVDNPPRDPFEEDYVRRPEWHTAGDVLSERYRMSADQWEDDDLMDEDDLYDDEELEEETSGVNEPTDRWDPYQDLNIEALPYDQEQERRAIPPADTTDDDSWEEEPLDEEPIFFEEPIE